MNYILLFCTIFILGGFGIFSNQKGKILKIGNYKIRFQISFLLICFILFLIAWYRDPLYGTDSVNYYHAYNEIAMGIDVRSHEIGYILLEKIGNKIGLNYQAFLRLLAVIIYIPIFYVYRKRNGRTAILLFFVAMNYFGSFSILRSYLSIAFLLLSYDFALEKKLKRALLCVIISVLFHNISIIYICLLLLSKIKVNKSYWVSLIFSIAIINAFGLPRVVFSIITSIWERYSIYSDDIWNISTVYVTILIILILMTFLNKKKLLENKENKILINYLYYITVIALFCPWIINYTRVVRLAFVFISILFGNILLCMDQRKRVFTYIVYSMILFGAMLLGQGFFTN